MEGNSQQDRSKSAAAMPAPPAQKCPRCDSANTKFCYYNNYSLTQPRYFCKTCRRYWTQGGTLRNVPVGGGCRKGKRAKLAASASAGASTSTGSPPSKLSTGGGGSGMGNFMASSSAGVGSGFGSFYPVHGAGGSGLLTSFVGIQSLNRNPQEDFVGTSSSLSSLGLLQGLASPFGAAPFYGQENLMGQLGNFGNFRAPQVNSWQQEGGYISAMGATSVASNSVGVPPPDTALWSTTTVANVDLKDEDKNGGGGGGQFQGYGAS